MCPFKLLKTQNLGSGGHFVVPVPGGIINTALSNLFKESYFNYS